MPQHDVFSWRYWELADGRFEEIEGTIAAEEPLRIEVNGQEVATLMRSPGREKELAIGFCLSEGLISDLSAIRLVHFCGSTSPFDNAEESIDTGNRVEIRVDEAAWRPRPPGEVGRLIRSGCGTVPLHEVDLDLVALPDGPKVALEVVLGLRRMMHQAQANYARSGGVHAAGIFDQSGELLALEEDVGRHNAVDKALGSCLLREIPLADKLILSTGRASYDMVVKSVRMRLPIVLSISSPTSLAVRLADLYRCTLGGYLRGRRLLLYTGPERITLP